MQSVCLNPLIATFQMSSAASLNLGWSQNGGLGNGFEIELRPNEWQYCMFGLSNCLTVEISHSDTKVSTDNRVQILSHVSLA